MSIHKFRLVIKPSKQLIEDFAGAIGSAGSIVGTPSSSNGTLIIDFSREAKDLESAIHSVKSRVSAAGGVIERVEIIHSSVVETELERLRSEYVSLGDGPFQHFCCPILLVDEPAELCMGHVINESIPNSCRKCVVQRKDVDGFYGTLFERDFAVALRAKTVNRDSIVFDPVLRRSMPWKVKVAGEEVRRTAK